MADAFEVRNEMDGQRGLASVALLRDRSDRVHGFRSIAAPMRDSPGWLAARALPLPHTATLRNGDFGGARLRAAREGPAIQASRGLAMR